MEMMANAIPTIRNVFKDSWNNKTPIATVIQRLITDHRVPVSDKSFCCIRAGNHNSAPMTYMLTSNRSNDRCGLITYFLERNSPIAKKAPDPISQTRGGRDGNVIER